MLCDLTADQIDEQALRTAIVERDREGIRTEFKSELRENTETALDVTAFANTAGGVLVVGAVTDADACVVDYPGVGAGSDSLVQRVTNVLRDSVDPPLSSYEAKVVDVDDRQVLVVHVSRSWRAPHLVRTGRGSWSLARRTSSGRQVLKEATEVRSAFLESEQMDSRLARWHDDRVAEVLAGQFPLGLAPGARFVMTIHPYTWHNVVDIARVRRDFRNMQLRPISGGHQGPKVNLTGVVVGDGHVDIVSALHLHRDGGMCFVDASSIDNERPHGPGSPDRGIIAAGMFCPLLLDAVERSEAALEIVGASFPAALRVSLIGADGMRLATHGSLHATISGDVLTLPAITLENRTVDHSGTAHVLRPVLDALWNAAGFDECTYFDSETGDWAFPY